METTVRLTRREAEVLRLIARGSLAIASALLTGCAALDFNAAPETLPTGRIAVVAAGYAPETRFEQAPWSGPTPAGRVLGGAGYGALIPLRIGGATRASRIRPGHGVDLLNRRAGY